MNYQALERRVALKTPRERKFAPNSIVLEREQRQMVAREQPFSNGEVVDFRSDLYLPVERTLSDLIATQYAGSSVLASDGKEQVDDVERDLASELKLEISPLFVVKKLFVPLVLLAFAVVLFLIQYGPWGFLEWHSFEESPLHYGELLVLRLHVLFLILEGVRWEAFRRRFSLSLERGRLHVTKGTLTPVESSVALMPNTEIYISRSKREVLLGICSLTVCTSLHHTAGINKLSTIEGLTYSTATALRDRLLREVKQQAHSEQHREKSQGEKRPLYRRRRLSPQLA